MFASPLPAAGLYYLAELVEEYSVLAKRVITYMLIVSQRVCFSLALSLVRDVSLLMMLAFSGSPDVWCDLGGTNRWNDINFYFLCRR